MQYRGEKMKDIEKIDKECLECKNSSCSYCTCLEAFNRKRKNIFRKMQNYVYDNLKRYGNTFISTETYNKMGEKTIKEDLAKNSLYLNEVKHIEGGYILKVQRC